MVKYQLFVELDRQNRIEKNKLKIEQLKKICKVIQEENKKNPNSISNLTKKYFELKKQIETLEKNYDKFKDKSSIYHKSDKIQMLSESIANKNEQIKFIECLRCNYNKKSLLFILKSFRKYYQYKKQVTYEETEENILMFQVIRQYLKQYHVFNRNKKTLRKSNNTILEMLLKYEFEKKYMLEEVEKLLYEIEEQKNLIYNYSKIKKQLEEKLFKIISQINQIINSSTYLLYIQTTNEILKLQKENQIYQSQIQNMIEIGKLVKQKKYKKL